MAVKGQHLELLRKNKRSVPLRSTSVLVPTKCKTPFLPTILTAPNVTLSLEPCPGTSSPILASVKTPTHKIAQSVRSLWELKSKTSLSLSNVCTVSGSLFWGAIWPSRLAAARKVRLMTKG